MLARVLAVTVCPRLSVAVCLSQVGVLSKWTDGLICLLTQRLLSTSPTLYFKETVSTKITVLPLELFLNSGLRKFRHGTSIVERAINLARG